MGGRDDGRPRDSEVKRRMIAIDGAFSENALGFGKFSKFLQYAESEGVATVERTRDGSYRVRLSEAVATPSASPGALDLKVLGLPTTVGSIKSYFANRYKGVGIKTAERLVQHFGPEVFQVLQGEPERIRKVLTKSRADSVLTAWAGDYERRAKSLPKAAASASPTRARSRSRDGRGSGPARTSRDRTAGGRVTKSPAPGGTADSREPVVEAPSAADDAGEAVSATSKRGRSGLFGFLRQGRSSGRR